MIITLLILGSIAAWAVASRAVFRHWIRNDTFEMFSRCGCGSSHRILAAISAALAVLVLIPSLPLVLFFIFVTARPPLGRRELAERTKALEAENARLRRNQGELP